MQLTNRENEVNVARSQMVGTQSSMKEQEEAIWNKTVVLSKLQRQTSAALYSAALSDAPKYVHSHTSHRPTTAPTNTTPQSSFYREGSATTDIKASSPNTVTNHSISSFYSPPATRFSSSTGQAATTVSSKGVSNPFTSHSHAHSSDAHSRHELALAQRAMLAARGQQIRSHALSSASKQPGGRL